GVDVALDPGGGRRARVGRLRDVAVRRGVEPRVHPAGERVAWAWRGRDGRDLAERQATAGRSADSDAAVFDRQVLDRGFEVIGGDGKRLLPQLDGRVGSPASP